MIATLTLLALGFLLGMRHATDPDHVVAVTTIVARRRSVLASSFVGAAWGLGHTLTILLVGGGMVLFEIVVPPRAFLAAELGVAVMLVALGFANLRRPRAAPTDSNARPFVVGTVHGLAGSGALVALGAPLVADPRWSIAALLCFGLGTVAGMMLVTGIIAVPARYATARYAGAGHWLRIASGVTSVVFGLLLAHHVGVVEGLFAGGSR